MLPTLSTTSGSIVASSISVVADLGGGHGDADGRVLLLRLGGPLLHVRLRERGA
uniref:Uncharacterized protein n=1 Tax=Oryza brachyantha TaxID=4533 RepID=J3LE80_ORYBR